MLVDTTLKIAEQHMLIVFSRTLSASGAENAVKSLILHIVRFFVAEFKASFDGLVAKFRYATIFLSKLE